MIAYTVSYKLCEGRDCAHLCFLRQSLEIKINKMTEWMNAWMKATMDRGFLKFWPLIYEVPEIINSGTHVQCFCFFASAEEERIQGICLSGYTRQRNFTAVIVFPPSKQGLKEPQGKRTSASFWGNCKDQIWVKILTVFSACTCSCL